MPPLPQKWNACLRGTLPFYSSQTRRTVSLMTPCGGTASTLASVPPPAAWQMTIEPIGARPLRFSPAMSPMSGMRHFMPAQSETRSRPRASGKRYLIHDRDPLFTEAVRGLLRDSGVKPLRLPANSPNLNAYAERFVLSIRRECLDRFVPLSERHLRTAVTEYVVHYHTERNHQGLGNELITPLPASANDAGPIVSRERLGGILNYYCRAA